VKGRVEQYLLSKRSEGPLHLSLIDPHKVKSFEELESLAVKLKTYGTDAFLVGGSLGISPFKTLETVRVLKKTGLPVIIFPGDLTNVVPEADAILFMSLLNSEDPYFIIGAQTQGALLVASYGLEPLPTAYIIVGYGGVAGFVGKARPIPWEHPELVSTYALSAWMLGMRFAYLEAGSGSPRPVPSEAVAAVKRLVPQMFVIVGGGIRRPETARELVESGADAIVTGTLIERNASALAELIDAIKRKAR